MTKQEKDALKYFRKASRQLSVWLTWNIPDGGYAECTGCGRAQMYDGLCQYCDNRLAELERLSSGKTK